MTAKVKSFVFGLIVGALLVVALGMTFPQNDPLMRNPFKQRDLSATIKGKAEHLADEAREKIHEATKPEQKR